MSKKASKAPPQDVLPPEEEGARADLEPGWRRDALELAALLRLYECDHRHLFSDLGFNGVFISEKEGFPLVWAVFDPKKETDPPLCESIWSVAAHFKDQRFEKSAQALLALESSLRESLRQEGGLSADFLWREVSKITGPAVFEKPRSAGRSAPKRAVVDGARAWARLSEAFTARSGLFLEALRAFEADELIAGRGKSALESQELKEQLKPVPKGAGRKGGAL